MANLVLRVPINLRSFSVSASSNGTSSYSFISLIDMKSCGFSQIRCVISDN